MRSTSLPSGRALLAGLLVALAGCAAQGPPARPADFPFHAAEQPLFALHWRLDQWEESVTAVGVVEASPERVASVVLELQGLDRGNRIVSRGAGHAFPMTFSGDEAWPFTVRLRPTGQEDRFVVRISSFIGKVTRGGA